MKQKTPVKHSKTERGMEMFEIILIILWLVIPLPATAIILVLVMQNKQYRKAIRSEGHASAAPRPASNVSCQASAAPRPTANASCPTPAAPRPASNASALRQHGLATVSLVIGVVFVVLAGLIFATTAWHVLPNICKALFVFAFAALFFASSYLADGLLRIRRTSAAFYLLGSIFLSLGVLALGYFELLGSYWSHHSRTFFIGTMVAELSLLLGTGRFRSRFYAGVCLCGAVTATMFMPVETWIRFLSTAAGTSLFWYLDRKKTFFSGTLLNDQLYGFLVTAELTLAACHIVELFTIPSILKLEAYLLPPALFLFLIGPVWKNTALVRHIQTVGFVLILLMLCTDAILEGEVADALILESICLISFLWAQIRGSRRWVYISAAFIIGVALYVTQDFWLSISWWIYLLIAGIALILFAALIELRKRQ